MTTEIQWPTDTDVDRPLHWRKPRHVEVRHSMSDLFHNDVPDEFIARVFAVMALAPRHTFQVLTKRPGRMASLLGRAEFRMLVDVAMVRMRKGVDPAPLDVRQAIARREAAWLPIVPPFPLPHVWLGTSVETQGWADVRIPKLLETPAAVRFLSVEPLLGPVDLTAYPSDKRHSGRCAERFYITAQTGNPFHCDCGPGIDWVIVGGESGPGARPMHPSWARSLRDQCIAAGVPFFAKQGSGPKSGHQYDLPDDVWSYKEMPDALQRS